MIYALYRCEFMHSLDVKVVRDVNVMVLGKGLELLNANGGRQV